MKKLVLLLLIIFSISSFADSIKRVSFVGEKQWEELEFNNKKNVYWYEIEGENALYTVSVSGVKSKIYGQPTVSPVILVYNETMDRVVEKSLNEKPILLELFGKVNKYNIQIMILDESETGNAYVKIEKVNTEENIYYRKKDNIKVQEFNENPLKFLKK